MIIKKQIIDDGKEKYNSIEVRLYVPTINMKEISGFESTNSFCSDSEVQYYFDTDTLENADMLIQKFIIHLAKLYNKNINYFEIQTI